MDEIGKYSPAEEIPPILILKYEDYGRLVSKVKFLDNDVNKQEDVSNEQ